MRILALTAALMIGTAAIAQTTTEPPAAPPADAMQTPPPADPAAAPAAPPATEMAAPATAAPVAQADYPRCSATVTDQCRQGSARESNRKGGPRKRRG